MVMERAGCGVPASSSLAQTVEIFKEIKRRRGLGGIPGTYRVAGCAGELAPILSLQLLYSGPTFICL